MKSAALDSSFRFRFCMKVKGWLCCLLCLGVLAACTPTQATRGNLLEPHQIEAIKTGSSTRADVLRILGSPTTEGTFVQDIVWYYLGQKTEKHGIFDPQVVEERIVIVTFDPQGIVSGLETHDPSRLDIPLVARTTPTHGTEMTIMQQFLGNLGRFNPPQSP